MKIVHQLRAGAPDKINLWTDKSYQLLKHDNTNLIDYSFDELSDLMNTAQYILPADEGDILHANKEFECGLINQSFILLPQVYASVNGLTYLKVIDHDSFVPKDSKIYEDLEYCTGIRYPKFTKISREEYECQYEELGKEIAIKSTSGSGSRGVLLVSDDPERLKLGGKWIREIDDITHKEFMKFCDNEKCDIIIQDLIPLKDKEGKTLLKCNTDFVIRDGNLLGYKWDNVNQSQQFTNWDNGTFERNEYTDEVMEGITEYLTSKGIVNAIMNFESYSNLEDETWMVEFNWRYSNSMFEAQAFNIDLVGQYLKNEDFELPYGTHKFSRYWQCALYSKIPGYNKSK